MRSLPDDALVVFKILVVQVAFDHPGCQKNENGARPKNNPADPAPHDRHSCQIRMARRRIITALRTSETGS
jgi:hypothetical protein